MAMTESFVSKSEEGADFNESQLQVQLATVTKSVVSVGKPQLAAPCLESCIVVHGERVSLCVF